MRCQSSPVRRGSARSLLRPCQECGRVYCVCPRPPGFARGLVVECASNGGSTVQPGKGTKPPAGGGVHPPVKGWGGKRHTVAR